MSLIKVVKTLNSAEEFEKRVKDGAFLVVDDFDSMRKVTMNQLRQLGATRIAEAANGAEALRVLARQPITMVLSDWNMPIMNGLDLLLTIRSSPDLFRLPVIMITAEAERERITQAIQIGVSELMVKPYTAGRLAERIEKALKWKPRHNQPIDPVAVSEALGINVQVAGKPATKPKVALLDLDALPTGTAKGKNGSEPAAAVESVGVREPITITPPEQKVLEKLTILVVDDTPDNLTLLSSIFKEEYRVKIAHNGAKALSICHSDNPPDLILLDIMMPGMDGFEVAQKLREHPASEHIPVIFVTAMTDDASRLKGMELGAVDFVTKPIDPVALRVRVKNFIRYIELHRQLQADYDNMMEVERLKEDVEHITRHDLKGPLAGVVGLLQSLVEEGGLSTQQIAKLNQIEDITQQTLNMVNLSNALFRIETGNFTLYPEPVQIGRSIRRIAEMVRKTFAVKKLTVAVATPKGMTDKMLCAKGDDMLCFSLFQNLIKNACEAAPESSTVNIKIVAGPEVTISIENQGVVPEAIRKTFFEKFATSGKKGGTGLGTYSAKLLTEAQGGNITMETSDENNQTIVVVTLPSA